MEYAAVIRNYGTADVMVCESVEVTSPGVGEIKVRHTHIGVNYHDIYVRSGAYQTLQLPGIPGLEAAGVVEKVGDEVTGFSVGDRVVYIDSGYGSYASARLLSADLAVRLPDSISSEIAAASFLRGLTVQILLEITSIHPGAWVLIHAAAGGVGQLLVQKALSIGVHVIGAVGSEEKVELLHQIGCKHVIVYRDVDFSHKVRELTGGRGVDVVYDSVGKDTYEASMKSLASRGKFVIFGQASGAVPLLDVSTLAKGSLTVTRPVMFHYIQERKDLDQLSNMLFADIHSGVIQLRSPIEFSLKDCSKAHLLLESRKAIQPLVLRVD
ncbi:2-haloacrylate reductase [Pseudomonas sp. AD21]|uniref:quinone oxidoreductase family protein n=1 Tax=Pseudomonas sp. AD21 TaxID=396378 RepID=UPI000CAC20BF|nr:quinone oxidoreductase [Pseudomonas sp. AD21]PMQ11584.1 2-haloacrylate reductase [Pseudomonas sp. AD21]